MDTPPGGYPHPLAAILNPLSHMIIEVQMTRIVSSIENRHYASG
ncbi:hypothetical protein [Methanospirillum lacunae]|nr:hypothetical protein [Methanospirillum lacunae]